MLDTLPVTCPWCGEPFEALADASAGSCCYVEDCPVCCRPILMRMEVDAGGDAIRIVAEREG